MTTSVAYLPPVSRSSARKGESLLREQVTEGPPYGRGELDTRWHLIRSAYDVLYEWADDISRVTMYWCGQQRSRRLMTTETIPPGEPTCGTCYGRREGWRRNHGLLFTPHHQTPPKVCPGSGHLSLAVNIEGSTYRCLACGSMVRGWAFESGYRARYGLRRHAPGPDLVQPCPFHAWRDLVLARDGVMDVAACLCQTRAVL